MSLLSTIRGKTILIAETGAEILDQMFGLKSYAEIAEPWMKITKTPQNIITFGLCTEKVDFQLKNKPGYKSTIIFELILRLLYTSSLAAKCYSC